jgi:hypothetical protein
VGFLCAKSQAAVAALLQLAGLRPERVWPERLRDQWNRSPFRGLASGSGPNRVRLSRLAPAARAGLLARANDALAQLAHEDFLWEGEVICAVATKTTNAREAD